MNINDRMWAVLWAAICLFPMSACADDNGAGDRDVTRLEEVLVTASFSEPLLDTTVVSQDDLKMRVPASSDTAGLLGGIPGVSVQAAGGTSGLPAVHGLADDRVRIKLDGMDLVSSCPNHMNPPLSYVDPADVAEVKIFAGITPVSVGGDSIAGTIVVNSRSPQFAREGEGRLLKGEAGVFYRSNGNALGGDLSTTVATENVSFSYSGTTASADNYKAADAFKTSESTLHNGHTLDLDEVGSSAYENWNHTAGFAVRSQERFLEAQLNYQDVPAQLFPNQRMDMLGNTQYRPSLRYVGQYGWGELEARLYHQIVDDHYMDFGPDKRFWYGTASGSGGVPCSPLGTTCAAGMPMYTESRTTGAGLKADIDLSANDVLRVGNELQFYRLDDWWPPSGSAMWPATFWNINDGERDRVALYGEWERQTTEALMTQLGLRYELVRTDADAVTGYNPAGMGNQGRDANNFNASDRSRTDHNWDLTALSQYTVSREVDLQFGYAHKTRSPNLYERYAWSTWSMAAEMVNWFGDGNGYVGDVDLDPEKASTVSATVDLHNTSRAWQLKATPYYTRVKDYIDAVQWNAATNAAATTRLSDQFTVLKFVNQSAHLWGLDLSGKMPLASTGAGNFGLKGLASYTYGRNLDTHDGLYNIMPINTALTLTHESGGWSNGLEAVLVGRKGDVSDARNELKTAGYGLFNLRGSYSWRHVRLDLGIENLFDKMYDLPLGGAYTGQGATMSLNPTDGAMAWGRAVPGPGRLVYSGLKVEF